MARLQFVLIIDTEGDNDVPLDIQKSIADRAARAISTWSMDNGLIADEFYEDEDNEPARPVQVIVTIESNDEVVHEVKHSLT